LTKQKWIEKRKIIVVKRNEPSLLDYKEGNLPKTHGICMYFFFLPKGSLIGAISNNRSCNILDQKETLKIYANTLKRINYEYMFRVNIAVNISCFFFRKKT
jgi:hypothetical protein